MNDFLLYTYPCVSADLYGRGYSDAPQTTYDAGLYTTQLALLMQHVGWDKACIAGVSMVRHSRWSVCFFAN